MKKLETILKWSIPITISVVIYGAFEVYKTIKDMSYLEEIRRAGL